MNRMRRIMRQVEAPSKRDAVAYASQLIKQFGSNGTSPSKATQGMSDLDIARLVLTPRQYEAWKIHTGTYHLAVEGLASLLGDKSDL